MSVKESFVKTTLKIRQDIFLKTKLLAMARGKTFSDILNEALFQYIKENEDEIKKKFAEVNG
jgi:predicted transcriptional regulator